MTTAARLECTAWAATDGVPYPQSVHRAGARHALILAGGGGGAAQLMPASLLAEIADRVTSRVREASAPAYAERMLQTLDDEVGSLTAGLYRGSGADAAIVVLESSELWASSAGLARVFAIRGETLDPITRADSLFQDAVEAELPVAEIPDFHHEIITRRLGSGVEKPWHLRQVLANPNDLFLLCSEIVHRRLASEQLARWAIDLARDNFEGASRALFEHGYSTLVTVSDRYAYERAGVIALVRVVS